MPERSWDSAEAWLREAHRRGSGSGVGDICVRCWGVISSTVPTPRHMHVGGRRIAVCHCGWLPPRTPEAIIASHGIQGAILSKDVKADLPD